MYPSGDFFGMLPSNFFQVGDLVGATLLESFLMGGDMGAWRGKEFPAREDGSREGAAPPEGWDEEEDGVWEPGHASAAAETGRNIFSSGDRGLPFEIYRGSPSYVDFSSAGAKNASTVLSYRWTDRVVFRWLRDEVRCLHQDLCIGLGGLCVGLTGDADACFSEGGTVLKHGRGFMLHRDGKFAAQMWGGNPAGLLASEL